MPNLTLGKYDDWKLSTTTKIQQDTHPTCIGSCLK